MKSLKRLERISVDVNNEKFASIDGALYNKTKEIFYGCPRGYKGVIRIAEGTKEIVHGGLVDCTEVTRVDLPESLESMSFKEFSRMEKLNEIIFRKEKPIATSMTKGVRVFLLQVANSGVKIIVQKKSRKIYENALVKQGGEFTEINGKIPFVVDADELPSVLNVKGVKNFNKYEDKYERYEKL